MAGHATQGELIASPPDGTVRIAVATPDHDPEIRRLLRENPTRGDISLTFEREPDYFHSVGIAGETDTSIVAFEDRRLVCMGRCVIRSRNVGGAARRVGYLGELRLDHSVEGRSDILRRGYSFFADLQADHPADLYFTSIASDNLRARHLLERGIRGLPRYRHLCDYVTLIFSVTERGRQMPKNSAVFWDSATAADLPAIVRFLNANGAERELTSVWTEGQLAGLQAHGLALGDIGIVRDNGGIDACAALWDQRSFRQTVIRGYSNAYRLARPLINLRALVSGRERLPAAGTTLSLAYLSPLMVSRTSRHQIHDLVKSLCHVAGQRGIEHLALGFDASDPQLAALGVMKGVRKYHSRLYQVKLHGDVSETPFRQGNLFAPELAFL